MLEKSTAASLFWNIDQMKEIASELSNAGTHPLLNLQHQVDDPKDSDTRRPWEHGCTRCGNLWCVNLRVPDHYELTLLLTHRKNIVYNA